MAAWDRRPAAARDRAQLAALRAQLVDAVGPWSPYWREHLADPAALATPAALERLPAAGERDLCPDGDPAGAAALVLQPGEQGFAQHATGPRLRQALLRRLRGPRAYAAVVEADVRPTAYAWAGLALRFPVASTRSDLDLVARAGARLWAVLGLTRADVLVAGVALEPTPLRTALELAALASGAPALLPGDSPGQLAQALRLLPATVLALPAATAADVVGALEPGLLAGIRTLLLLGAPDDDERAAARAALEAAGVRGAAVLAVHLADGHRAAWAECRESGGAAGLHLLPDLELVQLVDPETGAPAAAGEVVLTQLGWRGSALLRWRTADLAAGLATTPCPACGRTVARLVGVRRGALVPVVDLPGGPRRVDLRPLAAVLGQPDVADWRVRLRRSARTGGQLLLVTVQPAPGVDEGALAVRLAGDARRACGTAPSQVVLTGSPLGPGPRLPG